MVTRELSTRSSVSLSGSSSRDPLAPLAVKGKNITPIAAAFNETIGLCLFSPTTSVAVTEISMPLLAAADCLRN
jgi:hypothetical protein